MKFNGHSNRPGYMTIMQCGSHFGDSSPRHSQSQTITSPFPLRSYYSSCVWSRTEVLSVCRSIHKLWWISIELAHPHTADCLCVSVKAFSSNGMKAWPGIRSRKRPFLHGAQHRKWSSLVLTAGNPPWGLTDGLTDAMHTWQPVSSSKGSKIFAHLQTLTFCTRRLAGSRQAES